MALQLFIFIACIAVLAKIADPLVDAIVVVSNRLGVPKSIAGATLAAIATSAPELGTTLFSLLSGDGSGDAQSQAATGVGIATVLGSAAFNLFAILAVVAIRHRPRLDADVGRRDGAAYVLAVLALVVALVVGPAPPSLGRVEGALLLVAYAGYALWMALGYWSSDERQASRTNTPLGPTLMKLGAGIAVVAVACHFLVDSTAALSRAGGDALSLDPRSVANLSSLTVIAIGTSLPDLMTSLAAARRGEASLAISNAIGSNTFDVLVCLGLPYAVVGGPRLSTMTLAAAAFLLVSASLVTLALWKLRRVGRGVGWANAAAYVAFVGFAVFTSLGGGEQALQELLSWLGDDARGNDSASIAATAR